MSATDYFATKSASPKIESRAIADSVRGARQTAATIEDRTHSLLGRLRGTRPEAQSSDMTEPASDSMESNTRRLSDSLDRITGLLDEIEKLV